MVHKDVGDWYVKYGYSNVLLDGNMSILVFDP